MGLREIIEEITSMLEPAEVMLLFKLTEMSQKDRSEFLERRAAPEVGLALAAFSKGELDLEGTVALNRIMLECHLGLIADRINGKEDSQAFFADSDLVFVTRQIVKTMRRLS